MPADRRALRKSLKLLREQRVLLGFDFDCTLSIRHFYKVFAWCYPFGSSSHAHYEAFSDWCNEHDVASQFEMQIPRGQQLEMDVVLDVFCRQSGEDALHKVLREVFFGGSERINLIADWLRRMQENGAEFAIVTAGTSSALLRALAALPEWRPFFPSDRIWDTSQGRHAIQSVAGQKVLMLRDICPKASRIFLVDDSLSRDVPPEWACQGAQVQLFDLPYEGPGLQEESLLRLEEEIKKSKSGVA